MTGRTPRRVAFTAVWLSAVAVALAYEPGGHFYSVVDVFRLEGDDSAAEERRVEAFCSLLPDLAEELDATTQRQHVLSDGKDWMWGLASKCMTPTSTHMYAAQYYLHALTGKKNADVRAAGEAILANLARELPGELSPQRRVNLWCERGFATHLVGDTFAHTQLHGAEPTALYEPGLGHFRDFREPDLMLRRSPDWGNWVGEVSQFVAGKHLQTEPIVALKNGVPRDSWGSPEADDALSALLQGDLQDGGMPDGGWLPYRPRIETWNDDAQHGDWWNAPQKTWQEHFLTAACQTQVDSGPQGKGTGLPPVSGGIRPQCQEVWRDYLSRALAAFADAGVLGTDCDVRSDTLEAGRRP